MFEITIENHLMKIGSRGRGKTHTVDTLGPNLNYFDILALIVMNGTMFEVKISVRFPEIFPEILS